MKTIITRAALPVAVLTLAACGGGGLPSIPGTSIVLPAVDPACDTTFHDEIKGSYNGQVAFDSPAWVIEPEHCLWEVSLSVDPVTDRNGICQSDFEFQSQLISATPDCAELFTAGNIASDRNVDEERPQWPIALLFRSPLVTDAFKAYAPGSVNVGTWEFVFDGRGNIRPDQVSELSGWSGQLVSFSGQPFQPDDGASLIVGGKEND